MMMLELQRQAIASGYSVEWRKMRALVFHVSVTGKLIYPFEKCFYRWDGSGYDPGYEFCKHNEIVYGSP